MLKSRLIIINITKFATSLWYEGNMQDYIDIRRIKILPRNILLIEMFLLFDHAQA